MRSAVQSSWRVLQWAGFEGCCLQRRAVAVLAWSWLLAAVSALAAPEPATALAEAKVHASEVSPQAWLQRVQWAAERYSYEGTVVFTAGGVMSSSRIGHYRRGTESLERIEALDGRQQRRYRHDDLVVTLWPAERVASKARRDIAGQPGLLPGIEPRLQQHYELRLLGAEPVAGRPAQAVMLRPRDAWRYAQRLWADQLTGLLLRADVLGPDGRVLESSAFIELKMDVVGGHASVLTPLRNLGGWREVHLASQETGLEQEGWTLGPLPAGFSLVGAVRKALALPADPAVRQAPASTVHAVFSDGLARVSVFIEPTQGLRRSAFMTQLGATHTLAQPGGTEHWLTLMGDVPMSTLRAIAGVLQRRP
ncbi:MAG: MucB/RseB C-terminal domain-containing protein [Betaproteobacteria bacterium]